MRLVAKRERRLATGPWGRSVQIGPPYGMVATQLLLLLLACSPTPALLLTELCLNSETEAATGLLNCSPAASRISILLQTVTAVIAAPTPIAAAFLVLRLPEGVSVNVGL